MSFAQSKRLLLQYVYFDHAITFYCKALFDEYSKLSLPEGFVSAQYQERAKKLEWEHIVPAEAFGRSLPEWREGHPQCVTSRGKAYKGKRCAIKANSTYHQMYTDMHNLVPAISAENALRNNYPFSLLPDLESRFGSCPMKVKQKKAEPPEWTRGAIARTHKLWRNHIRSIPSPRCSLSKWTHGIYAILRESGSIDVPVVLPIYKVAKMNLLSNAALK